MRLRPAAFSLASLVLSACVTPHGVAGQGAGQPAAYVRPHALVSDGMVLQRRAPVVVWGWATPGGAVSVELAGHAARVLAGADSLWRAELPALEAGGPHVLTVAGADTLRVRDVLVGEVWLASGQSNMELTVRRADRAAEEIASAAFPEIRAFNVPRREARTPRHDVRGGAWRPATPAHVGGFSAVAYFFARRVHRELGVPVGILHASWGGSNGETWVSTRALQRLPELAADATAFEHNPDSVVARLEAAQDAKLAVWRDTIRTADAGHAARPMWSAATLDTAGWRPMTLPNRWEEHGLPGFDGIVWFRRTVDAPAGWADQDAELRLERVEDEDSVWVNGVFVGSRTQVGDVRRYRVPAGTLRAGANTVAVWAHDRTGFGGITGDTLALVRADGAAIPLGGAWRYRVGVRLPSGAPAQPRLLWHQQPGMLYNGLLAPLAPYRIGGVLWYQGESNTRRADRYEALLGTLIDSWRGVWGPVPFLVVQLPNYHRAQTDPNERAVWATFREAQTAAARARARTGVAVTIDVGDADDVHPTDKQTVGDRLARLALADVYGRRIAASGPVFAGMRVEGGALRLAFTGMEGGLAVRGSTLRGFAVAGADGRFAWAEARVDGDAVVVRSARVPVPVAVRYAWGDNPPATLYDGAGLPAAPFRTDTWPLADRGGEE